MVRRKEGKSNDGNVSPPPPSSSSSWVPSLATSFGWRGGGEKEEEAKLSSSPTRPRIHARCRRS